VVAHDTGNTLTTDTTGTATYSSTYEAATIMFVILKTLTKYFSIFYMIGYNFYLGQKQ
jgi:hypothetical protein